MSLAVFPNRHPIIRFGLIILTIIPLVGQTNSPSTSGLFMDLGIVIETSTGNEVYDRSVPSNSKEKDIIVRQVVNGDLSTFNNKELLVAIERINARLSDMETSFSNEVMALRSENVELKTLVVSLSAPVMSKPESPYLYMAEETPIDLDDLNLHDLPIVQSIVILPIQPNEFDEDLYRAGMYAYQCGNLSTALNCFSDLDLGQATIAQAENVLYWTADSYLQMHEFEKALATLDQLLNQKQSDMVDDALVKKGLLYKEMGDMDLAVNTFKKVVVGHPDSEYTRLATLEIKRREMAHQ